MAVIDLQNSIIRNIIETEMIVTVFMGKKGVPIRCKIKGNDTYTLLLEVDGKQQLVFKSAVSTISAGKQLIKF
ncbi:MULTISPECIES: RNA chaperone Hfq [Bacillaceae]|uniref:RNA chaperone Hfq n=1 Tax=Bacillaceae TaxID=186817 RepID=UPI001E59C0F7|nr:RNA chaperone Hfq [Bacillus sp. Au-Bac7]MCE4049184.1 RNA chaperone Hfq [Bacillus sp. Au-Bac7]